MATILGISAFYHDAAAALVCDGEIVAAAQEERFTRKKHDERFPRQAVEYCLQEAGLRPEQIDYVGFYDKPFLKFERLLETYLAFSPSGFRSFLTRDSRLAEAETAPSPRVERGSAARVPQAVHLYGAPRVARGQRVFSFAV